MLLSVHALAGAALGSLVGNIPGREIIAFGVGWASHLALDGLPHLEKLIPVKSDQDFSTKTPISRWPWGIFAQAAADVLLALAIIGLIVWQKNNGDWLTSPQFWGGIGAIMPDILDNFPVWNTKLRKQPVFKTLWKWHYAFHVTDEIQQKYAATWGVVLMLIIIGGAIWVLL